MSKTSRPPTFADSLNEKTAEEQQALADYRRRTQDAAKEQRHELGETLTRYAARELRQTASAIQRQAGRTIAAQWIRSLVVGLGV